MQGHVIILDTTGTIYAFQKIEKRKETIEEKTKTNKTNRKRKMKKMKEKLEEHNLSPPPPGRSSFQIIAVVLFVSHHHPHHHHHNPICHTYSPCFPQSSACPRACTRVVACIISRNPDPESQSRLFKIIGYYCCAVRGTKIKAFSFFPRRLASIFSIHIIMVISLAAR